MVTPGEVRKFTTGRSVIVLNSWFECEAGPAWVILMLSKSTEPAYEREMRLPNLEAGEAWNYVSISEKTIEESSTVVGTISEEDRVSLVELAYTDIEGTKDPSERTLALTGPKLTTERLEEFKEYALGEQRAMAEIEVLDPEWRE